MKTLKTLLTFTLFITFQSLFAQQPLRYATLELFTNTPCPICASQNPGFFNRLQNYNDEVHLISFYPGKPYNTCIFYQANTTENNTRFNHYQGDIFGSPTIVINGTEFRSPNQVTEQILSNITGGTSWLYVDVNESTGATRNVDINLRDFGTASPTGGKLYAVVVERQILYNAPNGETTHRNVFRKFLSNPNGDDITLTNGNASINYQYSNESGWNVNETYVIAWLMNPETEEIYNSGTKFDEDFTSSTPSVENDNSLLVYPNPATDEINIQIPQDFINAEIVIYSLNGQKLIAQQSSQTEIQKVSVDQLNAGKYVIKLLQDGKELTALFDVIK